MMPVDYGGGVYGLRAGVCRVPYYLHHSKPIAVGAPLPRRRSVRIHVGIADSGGLVVLRLYCVPGVATVGRVLRCLSGRPGYDVGNRFYDGSRRYVPRAVLRIREPRDSGVAGETGRIISTNRRPLV